MLDEMRDTVSFRDYVRRRRIAICDARSIVPWESDVSDGYSTNLLRCFVAVLICAGGVTCLHAADSLEIDACALLTADEISKVLAMPVNDGVRKDAGMQTNGSYSSTCVWVIGNDEDFLENPNAPLGGRNFVILNAMQWPQGSGLARTFLDAFHAAAKHGEIPSQPVPRSFGDEALWWGDGLAVRSRDTSFGLSVFIPGRDQQHPGQFEEQLAPAILKALGN